MFSKTNLTDWVTLSNTTGLVAVYFIYKVSFVVTQYHYLSFNDIYLTLITSLFMHFTYLHSEMFLVLFIRRPVAFSLFS